MDRIANEIKLVNEQIVEQDKKLEPIQNDLKKKERHLAELMAHDTKITGGEKISGILYLLWIKKNII